MKVARNDVDVDVAGLAVALTCRLELQRHQRSHLWRPLAATSPTQAPTPTPTPSENGSTGAESDEAAMGTGTGNVVVGSGGRLAGGTFQSDKAGKSRPVTTWGAGDEAGKTSERKSSDETSFGSGNRRSRSSGVKGSAEGRIRLKWGLDVDIPVRISSFGFHSHRWRGKPSVLLVHATYVPCI